MNFVDYLGNPISPGDLYVHPVGSGSSSASLNFGKIVSIIPLVEVQRGPRKVWTLDEYANRQNPTEYRPLAGEWEITGPNYRDRRFHPDLSRAYVVRASRLDRVAVDRSGDYSRWEYGWRFTDAPKGRILKTIDRIVVVTNNLGSEWRDRVAEAESDPA